MQQRSRGDWPGDNNTNHRDFKHFVAREGARLAAVIGNKTPPNASSRTISRRLKPTRRSTRRPTREERAKRVTAGLIRRGELHSEGARPTWEQRWLRSFDSETGLWVNMPRLIIHPRSTFMQYWNFALAFFILICVLYIPFAVGFNYEEKLNGTIDQAMWAVAVPTMDAFLGTLLSVC